MQIRLSEVERTVFCPDRLLLRTPASRSKGRPAASTNKTNPMPSWAGLGWTHDTKRRMWAARLPVPRPSSLLIRSGRGPITNFRPTSVTDERSYPRLIPRVTEFHRCFGTHGGGGLSGVAWWGGKSSSAGCFDDQAEVPCCRLRRRGRIGRLDGELEASRYRRLPGDLAGCPERQPAR